MRLHHRLYVIATIFLLLIPSILILQQEGFALFHRALTRQANFLGKALGASGYTFIVFALVLANRWRFLESGFTGLDKMYHTHRLIGITGMITIMLHPFALSSKWFFSHPEKIVTFLLPTHQHWEVTVGVFAYWTLLLLVFLTLTSFLPYDKWKITHRFMDVVFILASIHIFFSREKHDVPLLRYYLYGFMALGIYSLLWRNVLFPYFGTHYRYRVDSVQRLSNAIAEVTFTPQGIPMPYRGGQFAFFRFIGPDLSSEAHPLTICTPPDKGNISVIFKVLGDFTQKMYDVLNPGYEATVDGPYGRFDFLHYGNRQIWIGGGVGITPFLCWSRMLAMQYNTSFAIDLYYCVHDRTDAVHLEEFQRIQSEQPAFKVHLICTTERGHITAQAIEKYNQDMQKSEIFLCGPKRMTSDLFSQFVAMGVPQNHIYYEDFAFK